MHVVTDLINKVVCDFENVLHPDLEEAVLVVAGVVKFYFENLYKFLDTLFLFSLNCNAA